MEKKFEYNETVHQLFVHFKKAYDSVRREVFYNNLIDSGVPMKLFRLIKTCLDDTYSKHCVGKYLSDTFPIPHDPKQGNTLSPFIFDFALEYSIKNGKENQMGLQLNGTHQILLYTDDTNLFGGNVSTTTGKRRSSN
jgi:hypothetical protein